MALKYGQTEEKGFKNVGRADFSYYIYHCRKERLGYSGVDGNSGGGDLPVFSVLWTGHLEIKSQGSFLWIFCL